MLKSCFHLIVEKPHPVDGGQMRVVKILKQTVHQLLAVVNLLKGQDLVIFAEWWDKILILNVKMMIAIDSVK